MVSSLSSTVINAVAGLIVVRFVAVEEYGQIAYFLGLLGLLRFMSNLGMGAKAIQEVSRADREEGQGGIKRVFYNLGLLRIGSSVIVLAACLLIGILTDDPVVIWAGIAAFGATSMDYASAVIQGLRQKMTAAGLIFLQPAVFMALIFFLIITQSVNPTTVFLAYTISFSLTTLVGLLPVIKRVGRFLWSGVSLHYLRSMMLPLLSLFLFGLVSRLSGSATMITLGQLELFEIAAFFGAAFSIIGMIGPFGTNIVTAVFFPDFVRFRADGGRREMANWLARITRVLTMFLALPVAGGIVYADLIFGILYPSEYVAAVVALQVLSVGILLNSLQQLFNYTMIGEARTPVATIITGVQLIFLLISIVIVLFAAPSDVPAYLALGYVVVKSLGISAEWWYIQRFRLRFSLSVVFIPLVIVIAVLLMALGRTLTESLGITLPLVVILFGSVATAIMYILVLYAFVFQDAERRQTQSLLTDILARHMPWRRIDP